MGAASVRLVEGTSFTAATLAPSLAFRSAQSAVFAQATFSQVSATGWSTQGTAQVTRSSRVSPRGWMWEGEGRVGGSTFPGGVSVGQGLAALRAYRLGTQVALWAGAGRGALYDGANWRGLAQGELGATADIGWWRATLSVQPTVADDTLRFVDGLAALTTAVGPADVVLTMGARGGSALPIVGGDRRLWGGGSLSLWLAPRLALQAAAGAYPVDLTQGFPAGEYVSVSLQFGPRRRASAALQASGRRSAMETRRLGLVRATVVQGADGTIVVRVLAPKAQRLEIQSDATHWVAEAMRPTGDGWYEARLPGEGRTSVEMAVRVDGGAWRAPPGTDLVRDEFGGMSGRVMLR